MAKVGKQYFTDEFKREAVTLWETSGRMRLSPLYLRVVDVREELAKFTWLMRGHGDYLTSRYSERVESAEEVFRRANQAAL